MWAEAIVACYEIIPQHVLEEISKMTENFRIVGLQAQKWTRELPNTQACCPQRAVGVYKNAVRINIFKYWASRFMPWKNVTRTTCDTSYSSLQRLLPLLKRGIRSKGGRKCISRFSVKHEKVHPVVKVQQYGFGHFTHLTTSHHLKTNKTKGLKHMPIKSTLFELELPNSFKMYSSPITGLARPIGWW